MKNSFIKSISDKNISSNNIKSYGINEFIGKENNIATWNGTSWDFISPQPAFEMYILNKGKYEFNGTSWVLNGGIDYAQLKSIEEPLLNNDEFMIFRNGKPYKVSLQSLSNYLGNDFPATEYTDLNGQVLTDLENNYYTSL